MILNTPQAILTILVIAVITFFLRALPFFLFPAHIETPKTILYLSRVLPRAMIGLLVVYCLKNVSLNGLNTWLPEVLAIAFIVIIHLIKKNTLISIAGGTIFYMLLVQFVFI